MIRWSQLLKLLAAFILGNGLCLLVPLAVAIYFGDTGVKPFATSAAITLAGGALMILLARVEVPEITRKEGILFVLLAWLAASGIGALPFYFSPHFATYADAYFESISGFTTTGATIIGDVEALPPSILFWRALTHWLGGMGIIVLGIAILPLLGTGGMKLYRAEFSGARSERLKPRIAETAAALWKIYVLLTLAEYVALRLAGLTSFDSVCHSFATMATGGFSTKGASIEAFRSPLVEYIIVVFMIAAGINFTLHYRLFVQRRLRDFFSDIELRTYLAVLGVATLLLSLALVTTDAKTLPEAFRLALFQVSSIMTTTGFSSADFELWNPFSHALLLCLMYLGGCTGSTAGGLKIARIVMLFKVVGRDFHRSVERRGIFSVRFGGVALPSGTIEGLLNMVYLAFILNFAAVLFLSALGVDLLTALAATAATMFNIGPGLGTVGPAENYGHLPIAAKWILSFLMLAGRLEFYTVLVVLTPMFWRK